LVPYVASTSNHWLFGKQIGEVNTDKMYDLLVNKFEWGGFKNPDLYFDETNTRMISNFRSNYSRLAESLLQKGDTAKAIETIDKCIIEFPREVKNFSYYIIPIIDLYYNVGEIEKGNKLLATMMDDCFTEINYLKEFYGVNMKDQLRNANQLLNALAQVLQKHELGDSTFTYTDEDEVYFKNKKGSKDTIDYETYRINTFIDEYLSIQ